MTALQSSNITKLCVELGFGEGLRDSKDFLTDVTNFREFFEAKGNSIPTPGKANSSEAYEFALAFCLEDERGERLWPPGDGLQKWPSWLFDEEIILEKVTHIFALQTFYKYQRNLKAKRSTMPAASLASPSEVTPHERELSPESMIFVTPPPPSGTRRRPTKTSTASLTPSKVERHNALVDVAIQHVQSLNSCYDSKIAIKGINREWLTQPQINDLWPDSAIIRVETIMHDKDLYPISEHEDIESILKIINPLRKGTEIEDCSAEEYIILDRAVRQKMAVLSAVLIQKGLIEYDTDNFYRKTLVFRDIWKYRHHYWKPERKPTISVPSVTTPENIYDVPEDEPTSIEVIPVKPTKDKITASKPASSKFGSIIKTTVTPKSNKDRAIASPPVPSKPNSNIMTPIKSKPRNGTEMDPQSSSDKSKSIVKTTKLEDNSFTMFNRPERRSVDLPTITSPKRRKLDEPVHEEHTARSPSVKRQRITPSKEVSALDSAFVASPAEPVPDRDWISGHEHDVDSQETADTIRLAQEILQSDIGEARQPTRVVLLPKAPSQNSPEPQRRRSFSITPKSPDRAASASHIEAPVAVAAPPLETPAPATQNSTTPSHDLQPATSLHPPKLLSPTPKLEPSSPSTSYQRAGSMQSPQPQRLVLKIECADNCFDSKAISVADLRSLNVFGFFDLYAAKSKVSFDKLSCLTFTLLFAKNLAIVVRRGDDAQWKKLVEATWLKFKLSKSRKPDVKEFEVTIEIGDQTAPQEMDVDTDSLDFKYE